MDIVSGVHILSPLASFLTDDDGAAELQYLLASHSGQLCVIRDSTLGWSATLDHPPADITVASFP